MDGWHLGREGGDGVVTEVVYLRVKGDLDPTYRSKTLFLTLSTIASQPGCLSNHYNFIQESSLSLFFEIHTKWLTLKHHQDFMNSDIYGKFYNEVKGILAGDVSMCHFKGEGGGWRVDDDAVKEAMKGKMVAGDAIANANKEGPIAPRPLKPIVQVATFFCNENTGYITILVEFVSFLEKNKTSITGVLGAHAATVSERLSPPLEEGEKKEYAEVVMLMICWTDVEAHLAFKKTELFEKANVVFKGHEKADVHHVEFLDFEKYVKVS